MNRIHRPVVLAWLQGWPLLVTLACGLIATAAIVLARMPDVAGLRELIRVTARTSFAMFLVAFTASAAAQRWPGPITHWSLANRRQIGLGFAISHAVHAAAIAAFARLDPTGFHAASSPATLFTGGLAYVFIAAMAATSNDGAARRLGARRWRLLHLAGAWYLWLSFMITFGKRIPLSVGYAVPVVLLLAALALRLWPRRQAPVRWAAR